MPASLLRALNSPTLRHLKLLRLGLLLLLGPPPLVLLLLQPLPQLLLMFLQCVLSECLIRVDVVAVRFILKGHLPAGVMGMRNTATEATKDDDDALHGVGNGVRQRA